MFEHEYAYLVVERQRHIQEAVQRSRAGNKVPRRRTHVRKIGMVLMAALALYLRGSI